MRSMQQIQSTSASIDIQTPDSLKARASAHTVRGARTNTLNQAISATVREIAIAIWQHHPDWEGVVVDSPLAACNYVEFTLPAYPNLRLQVLPGRRVHITHRVYWDATLISSFDVPAYTERRHKPFFRRVIRSTEGGCVTALIDRWLALHGHACDALVAAEAAATEAKARRKQQERQQLWAQLLAPLPFEPTANIQTAAQRSTPQIDFSVGKVAVSATPDGTALTVVLTPEQKARLPEMIAVLNQMVQ